MSRLLLVTRALHQLSRSRYLEVVLPYISASDVPTPIVPEFHALAYALGGSQEPMIGELDDAVSFVRNGQLALDLSGHREVNPLLEALVEREWWCRVAWLDLSRTQPGGIILEVLESRAPDSHVVLSNSNLENLDLRHCDFAGLDMQGVNLRSSDLFGAKFDTTAIHGADLTEANTQYASFTYSNAPESNLQGVNLYGADLTGANFEGARTSLWTRWPREHPIESVGALSPIQTALIAEQEAYEQLLGPCFEVVELIVNEHTHQVWSIVDLKHNERQQIRIERLDHHDIEFRDVWSQESERLAKIPAHPAVLSVLSWGFMDTASARYPSHYATSRAPRGRCLTQILSEIGQMTEGIASNLILGVIEALVHALEHGIHHPMLEPRNIYVAGPSSEDVQVLFFSRDSIIAQVKKLTDRRYPRRVQSGITYGTPEYHSPEQAQAIERDQRSDVYVLGVILFEMLVGHPPFSSESPVKTLTHHVFDEAADVRALTDGRVSCSMSSIVHRALAKDPDHRFESIESFGDAVRAVSRKGLQQSQLPD